MDPSATVIVGRGLEIEQLGLGLVPLRNMFRAITDEEAQAALERWWSLGLRTFDVAPVHGYGIAERRLGRFPAGKPRDQFVVSTKVGRRLRAGAPPEPALWHDGQPDFKNTPPGIEPVFDFSPTGARTARQVTEVVDACRADGRGWVLSPEGAAAQDASAGWTSRQARER